VVGIVSRFLLRSKIVVIVSLIELFEPECVLIRI